MDDPLLDKMQALMGKYHAPVADAAAPHTEPLVIPDHDTAPAFPILTDIVKLGDAVFHDPQTVAAPQTDAGTISADASNQIAQQILHAVDAQMQNQVTALIAPRLQQAMDEALAALLPQLTVNIEHIIHETLVKEFARRGIPLNKDDDSV